jgi:hypothetical protein
MEHAEAAPGFDYREMRGLGDGDDSELLVLSPSELLAAVEQLRGTREEVIRDAGSRVHSRA